MILWIPTLLKKSGLSLSLYEDTFIVAAANLPGNIMSSLLIDWLGRKKLLAASMAAASGFSILLAFYNSPSYILPISCLFNAASGTHFMYLHFHVLTFSFAKKLVDGMRWTACHLSPFQHRNGHQGWACFLPAGGLGQS